MGYYCKSSITSKPRKKEYSLKLLRLKGQGPVDINEQHRLKEMGRSHDMFVRLYRTIIHKL